MNDGGGDSQKEKEGEEGNRGLREQTGHPSEPVWLTGNQVKLSSHLLAPLETSNTVKGEWGENCNGTKCASMVDYHAGRRREQKRIRLWIGRSLGSGRGGRSWDRGNRGGTGVEAFLGAFRRSFARAFGVGATFTIDVCGTRVIFAFPLGTTLIWM